MNEWRSRLRLVFFSVVAGSVLGGCAGGGGDGGSTGSDDGDVTVSPLAEFMGEGYRSGGGGLMVAVSAAGDMSGDEKQQMREVEELVATCMREKGFEYVPVSPDERGPDAFDDAYSLDPKDFAEQYGYGISTLGFGSAGESEDSDPNEAIREGLSASAQEAYEKALWGDMVQAPIAGGGVAVEARPPGGGGEDGEPGCQMTAAEEVFGAMDQNADDQFAQFDALFEDLGALHERIGRDSRVSEAAAAWSDCMAAAGQSGFEVPADAESSVMERMGELMGGGESDGGEQSLTVGGSAMDDVDPAALEELREYELAVAGADFDCQAEGYADVEAEVATAMEQEFVDEHRAELERYRDAMAEMGAAG